MYDTSGFLTVRQLIVYHTVLSIYKIKKTKEPEYLYERLSRENIRNNIVVDNTKMKLAKNSFTVRGPENWNLLTNEIRNEKKIKTFKTLAKKWIYENVPRFI